jgi:hypothetical protein
MRKSNIFFVSLIAAFLFSSCEDWLTVDPKDMISVEKALSEREGYVNALTGIYEKLENIYSPSSFLIGSGTDILANIYAEPSYSFSPALNSCYTHIYDDSNFDSSSGSCFLNMYMALANANVLIENIQETDVLDATERSLIEGEVKGIRALLQFDLWRLYGPVPGSDNEDKVLPYPHKMTKDLIPYLNYENYFEYLFNDLEDAKEALSEADPILRYSNYDLNNSGSIDEYDDLNWYYRQNRMNYYAVLGLYARVELWMGNKERAYEYAKEVVEAVNTDGTSKFTLGDATNIANGDYAFSTEHLFGVKTTAYDDDNYNSYNAFCVNSEYNLTTYVYKNFQTDIRYQQLLAQLTNNALVYNAMISLKYSNMSKSDIGQKNFPVIRLSEMYLILVETAPSIAEAQDYYNDYTNVRFDNNNILTESNLQNAVFDQYLREFWAEGQIFYACKRMKLLTLPVSGEPMTTDKYRVVLPTGETNSSL